jgi:hypothetical protein
MLARQEKQNHQIESPTVQAALDGTMEITHRHLRLARHVFGDGEALASLLKGKATGIDYPPPMGKGVKYVSPGRIAIQAYPYEPLEHRRASQVVFAPLFDDLRIDDTNLRIDLQAKQAGPVPLRPVGPEPPFVAVDERNDIDPVRGADRFHHIQRMKHLLGKIVVSVHVTQYGHGCFGGPRLGPAVSRYGSA